MFHIQLFAAVTSGEDNLKDWSRVSCVEIWGRELLPPMIEMGIRRVVSISIVRALEKVFAAFLPLDVARFMCQVGPN